MIGRKFFFDAQLNEDQQIQVLEMLRSFRAAVFIVAYNAEKHIESVIERIPHWVRSHLAEIFIIDDSSQDCTYNIAASLKEKRKDLPIHVYQTPFNRGYGGNQKLGYLYCIEKKYDFVVLMHGDGQYAPEYIPHLLLSFDSTTDAVFGSRMLRKSAALKGGMPFYKWIGNRVLTFFENRMLGLQLSEFHSGFRAYRLTSLKNLPFVFNSDDFHFDTEIIIQASATNWTISEVAVPTHYGNEKCHVNGLRYAANCIRAVSRYHLVRLGLFYSRNFDFRLFEGESFHLKKSRHSLHQQLLALFDSQRGRKSIELGAARGLLSNEIAKRTQNHTAVDEIAPDLAGDSIVYSLNIDSSFSQSLKEAPYDCCIVLDLIEHLIDPEQFLEEVFALLKVKGKLYISSANICYFVVRIAHLFGQFNYGKRGILDRTHKRLFSIRSLTHLLRQYGFQVESVHGFAPPFVDMIGNSGIMRLLESLHARLARIFPRLFAYNFLMECTRMDGIQDILARTVQEGLKKDLHSSRI